MAFEQDHGYTICGINGCILADRHIGECIFPLDAGRRRRNPAPVVPYCSAVSEIESGRSRSVTDSTCTSESADEPPAKKPRPEVKKPAAASNCAQQEERQRTTSSGSGKSKGSSSYPAVAKRPNAVKASAASVSWIRKPCGVVPKDRKGVPKVWDYAAGTWQPASATPTPAAVAAATAAAAAEGSPRALPASRPKAASPTKPSPRPSAKSAPKAATAPRRKEELRQREEQREEPMTEDDVEDPADESDEQAAEGSSAGAREGASDDETDEEDAREEAEAASALLGGAWLVDGRHSRDGEILPAVLFLLRLRDACVHQPAHYHELIQVLHLRRADQILNADAQARALKALEEPLLQGHADELRTVHFPVSRDSALVLAAMRLHGATPLDEATVARWRPQQPAAGGAAAAGGGGGRGGGARASRAGGGGGGGPARLVSPGRYRSRPRARASAVSAVDGWPTWAACMRRQLVRAAARGEAGSSGERRNAISVALSYPAAAPAEAAGAASSCSLGSGGGGGGGSSATASPRRSSRHAVRGGAALSAAPSLRPAAPAPSAEESDFEPFPIAAPFVEVQVERPHADGGGGRKGTKGDGTDAAAAAAASAADTLLKRAYRITDDFSKHDWGLTSDYDSSRRQSFGGGVMGSAGRRQGKSSSAVASTAAAAPAVATWNGLRVNEVVSAPQGVQRREGREACADGPRRQHARLGGVRRAAPRLDDEAGAAPGEPARRGARAAAGGAGGPRVGGGV